MKLKHIFENEIPKITNVQDAYLYAKKQGKRIPELEHIIMKDPYYAYYYAKDVIKGRWLEAEPCIFKNFKIVNLYLLVFPEARTPSKDVPLVLGNYAIMDVPNTITDEQLVKLINLIAPLCKNTHNVIFERLYFEPEIKHLLSRDLLKTITITQLMNDENLKQSFLKRIWCFYNDGDFE